MYMGKKFNSKKENAEGEKYKGIQVIRFYIKCGTCANMMTFKTDPERGDYAMESGGTRTFEMWQEANAVAAQNQQDRQVGENEDAMTALENRTRDTQKMVDMLDQLDELKAMSQRNQRIDADALMRAADEKRQKIDEANSLSKEDEELLKSVKFNSVKSTVRLDDDGSDEQLSENEDDEEDTKKQKGQLTDPLKLLAQQQAQAKAAASTALKLPLVKKVKKLRSSVVAVDSEATQKKQKKEDGAATGDATSSNKKSATDMKEAPAPLGLSGLASYGSSEDSD
jgi:hypothetical protein